MASMVGGGCLTWTVEEPRWVVRSSIVSCWPWCLRGGGRASIEVGELDQVRELLRETERWDEVV